MGLPARYLPKNYTVIYSRHDNIQSHWCEVLNFFNIPQIFEVCDTVTLYALCEASLCIKMQCKKGLEIMWSDLLHLNDKRKGSAAGCLKEVLEAVMLNEI